MRMPAAGIAVLFATVACSAFFAPPDVRIVGVRVVSLGLTAGTAAVDLEVENPNDGALEVEGVRYRLQIEGQEGDERVWRTLGEGFHDEEVRLAGGETTRVAVEIPFDYEVVGRTIRSLLTGEEVEYRLDGDVRVAGPLGTVRVPLETRGELPRL